MQFYAYLASSLLIYLVFVPRFSIDGKLFVSDPSDMTPIHDFANEFQNIMNCGENNTQKYAHLKEKFNSLMEIADIASEKIVQICNSTNDTTLSYRARQKLNTVNEKLKNFLNGFSNLPYKIWSELATEEEKKEFLKETGNWQSGVNFPLYLIHLQISIPFGYYMPGSMYPLQDLSKVCVHSDTSPIRSVQFIKSNSRGMVSAVINEIGPSALDDIYAMLFLDIVKLTFCQTLCDAAAQIYHPTGDFFYRNSFFNETVVEIFLSTDVSVKNSLAEYAAKQQDYSFASRFCLRRGLEVILTIFCAYCLLSY